MIEWIRDKFSGIIKLLFVLTILSFVIVGGFIGYNYAFLARINEAMGLIIGAVLGFLIGLIIGITTFGFLATVLHISETNYEISQTLYKLYRKESDKT